MSYSLPLQSSFPQDQSTNVNFCTAQAPNNPTSAPYHSIDHPFNPVLPISVLPDLSHDYGSGHSPGITPENTYTTHTHPTQIEPFQSLLGQIHPFQGSNPSDRSLFLDTAATGIWSVTSQDPFPCTTPTQLHHNTAVLLCHRLCNLTDQIKSLLNPHIGLEIPSGNLLSPDPVPRADSGYQPPNLATMTNSYTVDHLSHVALSSETLC